MTELYRDGIRVELAAQKLGNARVAWAETFLRYRINAKSDGQAKAMADVAMKGAIETAQAEYEIAVAQLHAAAREG